MPASRSRRSHATLRDTGPVAPATRAKVLAAVEELRFTPSRLGVSLAEGRQRRQRHRLPRPVGAVLRGGRARLRGGRLGAGPLGASSCPRAASRTYGRRCRDLARRVDGLVLFGQTVDDAMVRELAAAGLPVVLLARGPVAGADLVASENIATARLAHRAPARPRLPRLRDAGRRRRGRRRRALEGRNLALPTTACTAAPPVPCELHRRRRPGRGTRAAAAPGTAGGGRCAPTTRSRSGHFSPRRSWG